MYKCPRCSGEILTVFSVTVERTFAIILKPNDKSDAELHMVREFDSDTIPEQFKGGRCGICGEEYYNV